MKSTWSICLNCKVHNEYIFASYDVKKQNIEINKDHLKAKRRNVQRSMKRSMQGKTLRDQQQSKDRQRSDEMTKIEVGGREEMITDKRLLDWCPMGSKQSRKS